MSERPKPDWQAEDGRTETMSAPYLTTKSLAALTRRRHKYGVAPKPDRTYNGVAYASKAEAIRASELDLLVKAREVWFWQAQPKRRLGDLIYVPDFLVIQVTPAVVWFEDVKGIETPRFRQVRKLWGKYGPCELHVLRRRGNGWDTEVIEPVRVEAM